MKAAVVQKPNLVVIKEVPEPVTSPYDCLCQTLACAVCSGTDNHLVQNHPYFKIKFPVILGHEGIGRVINCGPKVKNFKEGDLITRTTNRLPAKSGYSLRQGAFAEKTIATDWQAMKKDGLPEKKWQPYTINRVLPKNFDPIASTMIITWRETLAFLKRLDAQKNQKVVIIGSGANALSFADHCKNMGLKITAIGSPKRKKQFLKKTNQFISYHQQNYTKNIKNKEFDIIIDSIGESKNVNNLLPLLKSGGKIGVYGLNDILNYKIFPYRARGDFIYYSGEIYSESSTHDDIINNIKKRKLNAWDYLSKKHIYPLSEIKQALGATKEKQTLKSVIDFSLKNR